MSNRNLLQATQAVHAFRQRGERRFREALAGDGSGQVYLAEKPGYLWVRLAGDAAQVSQARLACAFGFRQDDPVLLEEMPWGYDLLGFSPAYTFDLQYAAATEYQTNRLAAHGWQHELADNAGGPDPVNVHPRMVVPLRVTAHTPADLSLHVEAGVNALTGTLLAAQESAAFTPPTTPTAQRYDLLYLGADDALHILPGAQAIGGAAPAFPALPAPGVPLEMVYLAKGTTALTEDNLQFDARLLVGARAAGSGGGTATSLWAPLTNGSLSAPELVFYRGDVVMVPIPTP